MPTINWLGVDWKHFAITALTAGIIAMLHVAAGFDWSALGPFGAAVAVSLIHSATEVVSNQGITAP